MKSDISKLNHNQKYEYIVGQTLYAEVWKLYDTFFIFHIPRYGGMPLFSCRYHCSAVDKVIDHLRGVI